ncbi:MAG: UvrD-helicase domain-containing protein [Nitrospinae bacterium]|nr:UvrD-helicase domain-containing protein [Nitrospinota bacterium]
MKRDQWMIPFFDRFEFTDDFRQTMEETFSQLIEVVLGELHSILPPELDALPALAAHAGSNFANKEHTLASLADLKTLPEPVIAQLPQWKALAELLLTKNGTLRKPGGVTKAIGFPADKTVEAIERKRDFIKLLESLVEHENFIDQMHEARELPDPCFSDDEWNALQATLLLLPDMAATLRDVFMERGQTDFSEISLAARKALGDEENPTDLLLYLDYKIQHILVDEYQDTSYKQDDLLKRLTAGWTPGDGRTLFIVGDPMQSIYRFRDAEVGLFLKTKEEGVGSVQFDFLALKTNFRSQKKVVDWVNDCFSAVFPERNNRDLGAIAYSASDAALPEAAGDGVVLHPMPGPAAEIEAVEIGTLIENLRRDHPEKTIAILVRARSHLTAIVERFRALGIRFRAEDIDPLTSRPEIIDLLSLMRALQSPTDRVAWLSILRAPWCGLSLEDLHQLCMSDEHTPIWNLLKDKKRRQTLSADGRLRIERFISTLDKAYSALPMSNFRNVLEGCWINLGGPACADPETIPDIELFFDKVSDFIESGDLAQLRSFQRILQDLYASPMVEEENPVQIMTMHKAKGLEFDFVILPGLGKISKSEEKRLVYWMPHGDELLVAPIEEKGGQSSQIYNFLARFDQEKSDFESLRLLYVAATRAKTQLHLFGHLSKGDNPAPQKRSLLHKLWPHVGDEWTAEPHAEEALTDTPEEEPPGRGPTIRRLPTDFHLPDPAPDIDTGTVPELKAEHGISATYSTNVLKTWPEKESNCGTKNG